MTRFGQDSNPKPHREATFTLKKEATDSKNKFYYEETKKKINNFIFQLNSLTIYA